MSTPPIYEGRVLPTLNTDGTRRKLRPQLYAGRFLSARRVVGLSLIALFVFLPFGRLNGKPLMLLDVVDREFTLFGRTFLATDGVLLMLLMLSLFVGILLLTATLGRAWCGWGCPQTVYMEFLFRPIERLFEGKAHSRAERAQVGGALRLLAKNGVFLGLSFLVGNVFLAYFVGTERLFGWMRHSPLAHPEGFMVMAATAGLVFFDFAYFREQMCTVICPYARLQSALFDKDSLIVGYDERRGEPRSHGKSQAGSGDCIDCGACVKTCPTGIDIRKGLQLECIACAQCVDACDSIMARVKKPKGLIRYASQRSLSGAKRRLLRPRVFFYGGLLLLLLGALILAGEAQQGVQLTVLRGQGAPYVLSSDGVQCQVRLKIENHTSKAETYHISIMLGPKAEAAEALGGRVVLPENPVFVPSLGRRTAGGFVILPETEFHQGRVPIVVQVRDSRGQSQSVSYQLLGPVRP
jgi:cytochrome c oxidase accessory protein FixG